ncbi:uncharacterized protein LOC123431188 [Hordeum vulgare subsp. vulgare]|uniref:Uncharacterized protein n=1 Tax=Hordeum vulgare subsp. vulgare TaxID=112509 RepID=A0A8I6WUT9_HORVV|nr:uncharacterized protein LOC123431188 [Hordeum vulgare subsp. vulgare]
MSRNWGLAVPSVALLLLVLAATAGAAIKPLEEQPQGGKRADHLTAGAAIEPLEAQPQDGNNLTAAKGLLGEEPAARLASVRTEEKKDVDDAVTMPMEGMKPGGGVAIQQGGDPGTVPSASSASREHGKEESGERGKEESGGSSSTSKEGEKSAAKSCLTKEECHKKRLLCGKGCTLSAHAKCAAKCSKSCIATC